MSKFISSPETLIAAAVKIVYEHHDLESAIELGRLHKIDAEWILQFHISAVGAGKWGKLPRYIEPSFFGNIRLDADRPCRLCGLYTAPPRQTWHPACWSELYSYSALSWRAAHRKLARSQPLCAVCRQTKATEADHIVPLGIGGAPHPRNQQLLCSDCHALKTSVDMADIRAFKSGQRLFPLWYNQILLADQSTPTQPTQSPQAGS